jgi:hypothetical protein
MAPLIEEITRWWGAGFPEQMPVQAVEERVRAFPFDGVLTHWQHQGDAAVHPGLAGLLHRISLAVGARQDLPPGTWAWFLQAWLPMLLASRVGEFRYDAYVGSPVLHGLTTPIGPGSEPPFATEVVLAVLLALLLEFEGQQAAHGHAPVRRLSVVASALIMHRGDLLDRKEAAALWPRARRARCRSADDATIEAASQFAERSLAAAPMALRRFLSALLLPVTTEHDEVTSLRTLQLFETVFAAVLQHVHAEQPDSAGALLCRAIPFLRILGTLSADQYAVIQTATAGTTSLNSEAVPQVDSACSSPPAPTLAKAWRQWQQTHGAITARLLREQTQSGRRSSSQVGPTTRAPAARTR